MSQNAHERIGLDVGTSRVVMARGVPGDYRFASQLNAFLSLPYSKLTCGVLEKENIPSTVAGDQILVYGDAAERFADVLHVETRRPMREGTLNPEEPDGPAVVRSIIELLAGGGQNSGARICYTVPAPPLGCDESPKFHQAALAQLLGELGYKARSLEEGLAVVYSELEDSNYTGIGISCGAGLSNVCLAYLSVPVVSFSLPRAGDQVDAGAARAANEVATRVRLLKEQYFSLNGQHGATTLPPKLNQALKVYYEDLIQALVQAMREAFQQRSLPRIDRPIPLVLAGGSTLPTGFRERFEQAIRQTDFPLHISQVRLASEPLHATAKGALVAALADM